MFGQVLEVTGFRNLSEYTVCKINENQALFIHTSRYTSQSERYIYGAILTFSGNKISISPDIELYDAGQTRTMNSFKSVKLTDTKVLVTFKNSLNPNTTVGLVCSIENENITCGTPTTICSNARYALTALSSTKVFFTYSSDSTYHYLRARIISISGTNINVRHRKLYFIREQ